MKKLLFVIAGTFVLFVVLINIWGNYLESVQKPFGTYYRLITLSIRGFEDYRSAYGRWPGSVSNAVEFDHDLGVSDEWGNQIGLIPYNEKLGYGQLISYGRDGKPGGTGLDRDWIVRFPVYANYAWDKKQAEETSSFRGLPAKAYWFDGHVEALYWPATNSLVTNADWGKP
jgi:hypothetical protein